MLEQPGRVFTRDELLGLLPQKDQSASPRAVDSCMTRLRRKLAKE